MAGVAAGSGSAVNPAAPATDASRNELATGVITYREDGKVHQWSIGCMAHEPPESLRNHLARWKPAAEFVAAKIIPDKRKKNT